MCQYFRDILIRFSLKTLFEKHKKEPHYRAMKKQVKGKLNAATCDKAGRRSSSFVL